MNKVIFAILFCLSVLASGGEPVDFETFYGGRLGQVFKAQDEQEFQIGFFEGGKALPTLTWEGLMANRNLYVEVQGTTIKLISGKQRRRLPFKQARSLAGENFPSLDVNSARIFVASSRDNSKGILCIEGYENGVHRSTANKEIYVIVDPHGQALMFKMPRRNASSLGLVRTAGGEYAVPESQIDGATPPNLKIQYHRLTPHGFAKEGPPIAGRYVAGDDFHFEVIQ